MFSWYRHFIRPILFLFPPEFSHRITLQCLHIFFRLKLLKIKKITHSPSKIMGLYFPNKIGLAAGMDSNGDYIDALASLGFGFIEIGGVTPKPQKGNPKPRLFRLISEKGLINRKGFNNHGLDYMTNQLKKIKYQGILGINLAKNKATPNDQAVHDYLAGFHALSDYASYFTINLSSPNTPGLRHLLEEKNLRAILQPLKKAQSALYQTKKKYIPLVIKISPDASNDELKKLANILLEEKADGVIATNTTINRETINSHYAKENGGLSGRPLEQRSTEVINILYSQLQGKIPIIASGGVMDEASARAKFAAGAQLLQVYTGLIYEGPTLVERLASVN